MIRILSYLIFFTLGMLLFRPILLEAVENIQLPEDLKARAFVIKSEKDGLWEKSLIIQFSERRRVLSTNDGFLDALAVVNHSAHPLLWERVCKKGKTKEVMKDIKKKNCKDHRSKE